MNPRIPVVAAVLGLAALPFTADGQAWRTFEVSRAQRDSAVLSVRVDFSAGRLSVRPAPAELLYHARVRYDADRVAPSYAFSPVTRELELGLRRQSRTSGNRKAEGAELDLRLSPSVPLRLELDVGAAEADLNLGGLRLDELVLKTGAAETRLRFDTPNPRPLRTVRIDAGAAGLRIAGFGNANAERLDLNLGIGSLELDLGGDWQRDLDIHINSVIAGVTILIPADIGVRIESSSFLHSVSVEGLTAHDGYQQSSNWDTAPYKLHLRGRGVLGSLSITRVAR